MKAFREESALLEMLRSALGRDVRRLPSVDTKNSHFEAIPAPGKDRLFVKIIEDKRQYFDAELAAHRALLDYRLPHIAIRHSGSLDDRAWWIAYEWIDLKPFRPSGRSLRELATTLGKLHRSSRGVRNLGVRRFAAPADLARSSIMRVRQSDNDLAERLDRLLEIAMLRWPSSAPDAACMLHGDFGFRNVGYRSDEELVLFDFEHASIGAPILEFAKAWDRELFDRETRTAFLSDYSATACVSVEGWEDAALVVRLWAAAGIFPYALQHGDRAFAEHGLQVIARLEREVSLA